MEKVESIRTYLDPVRKSVVVKRTPEEAFEIFTRRIASWWPTAKYSLYQAESAQCGLEPRVGGQIYEVSKTGERGLWGTLSVWDPPRRFVTSWHPGTDPATATELELRFVPVPEGTRVELEHRHWERLGSGAAKTREGYDSGWVEVFEQCFKGACD